MLVCPMHSPCHLPVSNQTKCDCTAIAILRELDAFMRILHAHVPMAQSSSVHHLQLQTKQTRLWQNCLKCTAAVDLSALTRTALHYLKSCDD